MRTHPACQDDSAATTDATPNVHRLQTLLSERYANSKEALTIKKVIDVIEKYKPLTESNFLQYQARFCPMHYINGIELVDLGQNPVVWGIDDEGRIFITFGYETHRDDGFVIGKVRTLFERHTGGNVVPDGRDSLYGDREEKTLEELETLFSGGTVDINGYGRPFKITLDDPALYSEE